MSIVLALWASFAGCTCTEIAGPDAQLREAAKSFGSLRQLPEAGLGIQHLQVTRITPEPELQPPRVVFSYDLDGAVMREGHPVAVSAIGVERLPMRREDGRYLPIGSPLPNLAATLKALPGAPARFLIRVDVGQAEVTAEQSDGGRQSLRLAAAPDGGMVLQP